jgi:hypothetical protein
MFERLNEGDGMPPVMGAPSGPSGASSFNGPPSAPIPMGAAAMTGPAGGAGLNAPSQGSPYGGFMAPFAAFNPMTSFGEKGGGMTGPVGGNMPGPMGAPSYTPPTGPVGGGQRGFGQYPFGGILRALGGGGWTPQSLGYGG